MKTKKEEYANHTPLTEIFTEYTPVSILIPRIPEAGFGIRGIL